MYKFKHDEYQKNRGGTSRVLDISCDHCSEHVTYYQKDGPGMLKRMYVDRFIGQKPSDDSFSCPSCDTELGKLIEYKKESRPAYRLFAGAVNKHVISQHKIS